MTQDVVGVRVVHRGPTTPHYLEERAQVVLRELATSLAPERDVRTRGRSPITRPRLVSG